MLISFHLLNIFISLFLLQFQLINTTNTTKNNINTINNIKINNKLRNKTEISLFSSFLTYSSFISYLKEYKILKLSSLSSFTSSSPRSSSPSSSSFLSFFYSNNKHSPSISSSSSLIPTLSPSPSPSKQKNNLDNNFNNKKEISFILSSYLNEKCTIQDNPILYLRGKLCGKYYKIFQINKYDKYNLKLIKKQFYLKSKLIHPDKNPLLENISNQAFNYLSESYLCLKDFKCKNEYDNYLSLLEMKLYNERKEKFQYIISSVHSVMFYSYHYISILANYFDQGKFLLLFNIYLFFILYVQLILYFIRC